MVSSSSQPQALPSAELLSELARLHALIEKLAKQDLAIEQEFLKKMQMLSEVGSFYASNPLLLQLAEVFTYVLYHEYKKLLVLL